MGSARLAARHFTPMRLFTRRCCSRTILRSPFPSSPAAVAAGGRPAKRPGNQAKPRKRVHDGSSRTESKTASRSPWRPLWVHHALVEPIEAAAVAVVDDPKARPAGDGIVFEVTVCANTLPAPAKGRLYVFLIPGESRSEPRLGPNWFQPQPFYAVDVDGWKPGQTLSDRLERASVPRPAGPTSSPGKYTIQAVFRLNPDTHRIGDGEGNAYGPSIQTELDPKKGARSLLDRRPAVPRPDVRVDRPDQAGRA